MDFIIWEKSKTEKCDSVKEKVKTNATVKKRIYGSGTFRKHNGNRRVGNG